MLTCLLSLLALSDVLAAFVVVDQVDHHILLERLETSCGIKGPAVKPPLIDRSSEYVAFISETRAGAIYGSKAKMLTALWQDSHQRKFYVPGMLQWHAQPCVVQSQIDSISLKL